MEAGETTIQTLHREIKEELGVAIKDHSPYYSYTYEDQEVDNFLVTIDGDINVGEEITGYTWYSSDSKETPSSGFIRMTLPKLIQDGLVD